MHDHLSPFTPTPRVAALAQELAAELIRAETAVGELRRAAADAIEDDVAARLRLMCAVFDPDDLDDLLLLLAEAVDNLGGPDDHNAPGGVILAPPPRLH